MIHQGDYVGLWSYSDTEGMLLHVGIVDYVENGSGCVRVCFAGDHSAHNGYYSTDSLQRVNLPTTQRPPQ